MDINQIKLDNNFKLIEASAGTGKSFTLAHLVLRNVLEKKIKPDEILLLSFTKNTCSELRDKILLRFKNLKLFLQNQNEIKIDKVFSSEWCRCKETAKIAFKNYTTKSFLNSFYSSKFAKNKDKQVKALKEYIKDYKNNNNENLVLVTHYVLISEILNYGSSSGEIVVSDKNFNIIDTQEISY